jgi:ectoine hydroxylase-related dioxygenase (phytanoyl-CoA dioxygenase family)
MDRGTYGAFSLLIGVALSDQLSDYCGNLCLHPGSHHLLKAYMKSYAKACDDTQVDKGDVSALQAHRLNAVSLLRANKPTLDEPVQVKLHRGDVVFSMHKVAHLGGPNYSSDIRKMVYFRVSHRNLHTIRDDALDNLWLEYEGMKEVL